MNRIVDWRNPQHLAGGCPDPVPEDASERLRSQPGDEQRFRTRGLYDHRCDLDAARVQPEMLGTNAVGHGFRRTALARQEQAIGGSKSIFRHVATDEIHRQTSL